MMTVDGVFKLVVAVCGVLLFQFLLEVGSQPPFDDGHSGIIVLGYGAVMDTGIDHGGIEPPVPQQRLDGGDATASVHQLGGTGVAQAMGRYFDTCTLAGQL